MHAWCRNASEKGAEEEAERQLVSVKKLKGEVTRKEGMLKATQAELDKVLRATQPAEADRQAAEADSIFHQSSGE